MNSSVERLSRVVADRINVDIEGLREEIDKVHDDNPLWSKLSMAQKLRQLIEEAIATAKSAKAESGEADQK